MSQLKNDKVLVSIFLELLFVVRSSIGRIHNGYFIKLLSDGLVGLFLVFVEYVKFSSNSKELLSKMDSLIQAIETLHHTQIINELDYLLMLKSSYLLKRSILNSVGHYPKPVIFPLNPRTETVDKSINIGKQIAVKNIQLNHIKKDLLDIIKTKKEVLNVDLFALMPNLTRRSIKRHISDLVSSGYVYRKSIGKKVYYMTRSS